ncbi:MAG: hypothetical protein BWY71_00760 [Planctomycetes bacterium ADurb.Bin412]|nr:MAG: hypothetical protein BWY71_00760 [Planctomycetes bacterium ADurb.Bin412]
MKFRLGILLLICLALEGCKKEVRTGLDRVEGWSPVFANRRVGIITNHTGYNRDGEFIVEVFREMEGVQVAALFGPEHGVAGLAQAGEKVQDQELSSYGIPIYSLYGENRKPTEEMLKEVDVLVFDMQDIGARFYTYISTMALAMEAAAEKGIPFVVLDRPNPIGGRQVQGNVLDPAFATFVGLYPIATRHGMTAGELAKMFNGQGWLAGSVRADLLVIPVSGYKRSCWYDQTGLAFIKPSPNIPDLQTAAVYPGMCLLEGTNVSEGRGTDAPFLQFGAPWIDVERLTAALNNLNLAGLKFEAAVFTPASSKFKDEKCFGARILVTDRNKIDPCWGGVLIVDALYRLYPDRFAWHENHFDRLCGTDRVRKAIVEHRPLGELKRQWETEITAFKQLRAKYLLY